MEGVHRKGLLGDKREASMIPMWQLQVEARVRKNPGPQLEERSGPSGLETTAAPQMFLLQKTPDRSVEDRSRIFQTGKYDPPPKCRDARLLSDIVEKLNVKTLWD